MAAEELFRCLQFEELFGYLQFGGFINVPLSGWTPFSNFSHEIEFRMDCLPFIIQMALRRGAGSELFLERSF